VFAAPIGETQLTQRKTKMTNQTNFPFDEISSEPMSSEELQNELRESVQCHDDFTLFSFGDECADQ
jgi:hypothetical protein